MHSKTIFKESTVEMYAKSMYAYRNDALLFWYISRKDRVQNNHKTNSMNMCRWRYTGFKLNA